MEKAEAGAAGRAFFPAGRRCFDGLLTGIVSGVARNALADRWLWSSRGERLIEMPRFELRGKESL